MDKTALKRFLIDKAKELGFDEVRISKAEFMEEEAPRLEDWLNNNHHGNMDYLADHFDKRVDPTVLVPGAKSVVSLMFNYYPEKELETQDNYKIARYAYGKDYHYFVKKKLNKLIRALREEVGEINGRAFVDSAPVLERDWAKRSGLGWIGKNSLLLNKDRGSYFFLAELIIDLEFEYDNPVTDLCGTCTRCIDACPTEAIAPEGFVVDGSKCISYLTIELKEKIPNSYQDQMNDWILGCDICQEVCPWNRFSKPNTNEPRLKPKSELQNMRKKDWEELTEDVFNEMFSGTPFKRLMYHGLKRNIDFISENTKEE